MEPELEEILSQRNKITWKRVKHDSGVSYCFPTIGGGLPTTKTDTYKGDLEGREVSISRSRLTLSADTLLNLHPDYNWPDPWYTLKSGALVDTTLHWRDEGHNKMLAALYQVAHSAYRRNILHTTLKNIKELVVG